MRLNVLGGVVTEKAEQLVRRLEGMKSGKQKYNLSIRADLESSREVHSGDLGKGHRTSHSNLRKRRKTTSKHVSKLYKSNVTNSTREGSRKRKDPNS